MARLASVLVLLSSFVWPDAGRAQSTDLSTYVVFAQQQVKLSGTNGVGNVGSNTGDVTFGGNSILLTGDVAGNRVRFSASSAGVLGTLYCNLLAKRSYQSFVCNAPLAQPVLAFPSPPVLGPLDQPPVTAPDDATTFVAAGGYPFIKAGSNATVVLTGGTYDVGELVLKSRHNTLICQSGQTCLVRVGTRLGIRIDHLGDEPGALTIQYAGTKPVPVGAYLHTGFLDLVRVDVIAPNAVVSLQKDVSFIGHLVGQKVVVSHNTYFSVP